MCVIPRLDRGIFFHNELHADAHNSLLRELFRQPHDKKNKCVNDGLVQGTYDRYYKAGMAGY